MGPIPVYTGTDPALSVISKKLSKKNSTTRLKALIELKDVVQENPQRITPDFISFFVFLYERVLLDNDRNVRENLNLVLGLCLKIDRKLFKLYIETIIGSLYIHTSDPVGNVSQSAKFALEALFPNPQKRIEILSSYCSLLMNSIKEVLKSKPETLSDMSLSTIEEAEERYERVLNAALLSLANLISTLPSSVLQDAGIGALVDIRFWKRILGKRNSIRQATLLVLIELCNSNPGIVTTSVNLDQLMSILLDALSNERSNSNIPDLLRSLIFYFKAFPQCISISLLEVSFFPQLQELLKSHFEFSSPAVLPLFASIPLLLLSQLEPQLKNFLELLSNIPAHRNQLTVSGWMACTELSAYLTIQALKITDEIPGHFIATLLSFMERGSIPLLSRGHYSNLIPLFLHLHRMSISPKTSQHFNNFWKSFSKTLQNLFLENITVGFGVDFLKVIDCVSNLFSFLESEPVVQDLIGGVEVILSLYKFSNYHLNMLSIVEEGLAERSQFAIIWNYLAGKMGFLLFRAIQTNSSELISQIDTLMTCLASPNYQFAISFYLNTDQRAAGQDSFFELALALMSDLYDLSWKMGNFLQSDCLPSVNSMMNFSPEKLYASLLQQIYCHRSILEFGLALKAGIVSVYIQTVSTECVILSWIKDYIQEILSSKIESSDHDIAVQVVILYYCEQTKLFELDMESVENSPAFIWKELSRYSSHGLEDLCSEEMEDLCSKMSCGFLLSPETLSIRNLKISQFFHVITSWKDIQCSLLINTSPSFAKKLVSEITFSLKMELLKRHTTDAISADAKIFCAHISLLSMLAKSGIFGHVDLGWIGESIGLSDVGLWESLLKPEDTTKNFVLSFILEVVFQFNATWSTIWKESQNPCHAHEGLMHLLPLGTNPMLCLNVFRTLLTSRRDACNTESQLIHYAIDQFQEIVTKTLQSRLGYIQFCSDLVLASQPLFETCRDQLELENSILSSLSLIFRSPEFLLPRTKDRSSLDFISFSPTKGNIAYYIGKEQQSDATFISAQSAIVLEYDHRPDESPFYTLGLDSREIQTEANRVIVSPVVPAYLNHPDLVMANPPSQSRTYKSSQSFELLLEHVSSDLSSVMTKLSLGSDVDSTLSARIQPLLLFFRLLSPSLDTSLGDSPEYWLDMVGFIRHSLILLLVSHPISNLKTIHCGLDLLSAVCLAKLIRGSGLWIYCCILPSLWKIFRIIKTSRLILSHEERLLYLEKLLSAINSILSYLPSSYITELAIPILELALLEFTEGSCHPEIHSGLLEVSLECSENIWAIQYLEGKTNRCLSHSLENWENQCCKICVELLLSRSTQIRQGFENTNEILEFGSLRALDAAIQLRESELLSILIGKFNADDQWKAWNIISNPHIHISFRSSLAKILYIWSNQSIPRVENELLDDDVAGGRKLLELIVGEKKLHSFEANLGAFLDIEHNINIGEHGAFTGFECSCGDHIDISLLFPWTNQSPATQYSATMIHIDICGIYFQWLTILKTIESYFQISMDWVQRTMIGNYFSKSNHFRSLINILVRMQHYIQTYDLLSVKDISKLIFSLDCTASFSDLDQPQLIYLVSYALWKTICFLPGAVRVFYLESCSRSEGAMLEKFVELTVNESLWRREASIISAYQQNRAQGEQILSVRCSITPGEITTSYIADEVSIEMTIHIPKTYPLRNVEVECKRRMGISEGRWRRWILQIIQLLSQSDGSVLDAILLWKKNVDKEFEGVEPCPICYSVLDSKSLSLPTLQCPTCKNKFHPACLYKWFNSSGKSKCVLCQQPFFN